MSNDWDFYEIADLIENNHIYIGDGYRAKNSELTTHGLPFARSSTLNNGFNFDDADCYPLENIKKVGAKVSQIGDVVFTSKGSVGRFGFVNEYIEQFVYSPQLSFWRSLDHRFLLPRYLYYWMYGREFYDQYFGVKGQTDMADYVSLRDQRQMHITLPPIEEQREIANILGSLDDKIEANRRENDTLKAIARAIFKSWFVDFDPVHAKANGEQPYGMDAETAELFPDEFEDSELGMIPRGWSVGILGDHIDKTRGLSYKGKFLEDSADNGLPMHNLNSVLEWGGYKYDGIKYYSGDFKERHSIKSGDLIVANTEQGFNLLLIASPAIVPRTFGENGIFSHHLYKVVPKPQSHVTRLYLYFMIMLHPLRAVLQGYTNGTTVNMLPKDAFELPDFILPSRDILSCFDEIIQPMLDRIVHNHDENKSLAETRDALLQRLISGELRVGEV